ncbi:MAG: hypothetical protein ACM31C_12420 [Acidobacteriota bacterium]
MGAYARLRELASSGGAATTAGMLAARTWLVARGVAAPTLTRWHATVLLAPGDAPPAEEIDEARDTRFRVEIFSEEWGFLFCHAGHASWIRITDIPFVHGRDDFRLLAQIPALEDLGALLRRIERHHGIELSRQHALVRTNLPAAERAIRSWVAAL